MNGLSVFKSSVLRRNGGYCREKLAEKIAFVVAADSRNSRPARVCRSIGNRDPWIKLKLARDPPPVALEYMRIGGRPPKRLARGISLGAREGSTSSRHFTLSLRPGGNAPGSVAMEP